VPNPACVGRLRVADSAGGGSYDRINLVGHILRREGLGVSCCAGRAECPSCGGSEHDRVETYGNYEILACRACRLSFANPMKAGAADFYMTYLAYRPPDEFEVGLRCRAVRKRPNRALLSMIPEGSRILDIGCGCGAFVHLACELGYDAFGIDFNEEYVEAGRRYLALGDRLVVGDIGDLVALLHDADPFHLITMFEFIEHIENPSGLMRDARKRLVEGGLLALSCPNEARWKVTGRVFVDYPPHHLTRWSPNTLRRFLEKEGFEHVQTEVQSSVRDWVWVAYMNRSARRKMADNRATPPSQEGASRAPNGRRPSTLRLVMLALDRLLRILTFPVDVVLRFGGIGTMGMRIVVRKTEQC